MVALRTILLVDDDDTVLDPFREMLELSGFEVTVAGSGNQALSILENRSFDAIVSDMRMEDGDGLYLLDSLRELKGEDTPPFYLLTGYPDLDGVDVASRGAKALFQKPLKIGELISAINREFS